MGNRTVDAFCDRPGCANLKRERTSKRGRTPRYCSDRCQSAASSAMYRARKNTPYSCPRCGLRVRPEPSPDDRGS